MAGESHQSRELAKLVKDARQVDTSTLRYDSGKSARPHQDEDVLLTILVVSPDNLLASLLSLKDALIDGNHPREAEAVQDVFTHCITPSDFGGLAMSLDQQLSENDEVEILFLVSAYLEGLNSADRQGAPVEPLNSRPAGRRGMTLAEKIFAAHDTKRRGEVKPGDVIRVDVDWVMASELSWGVSVATPSIGPG